MLAVMLIVTAIPFTTFAATTGDVNGDGNISAVDARLILQVVAELKTADSLQNTAGADVNDDGKITAVDARIVLQMVAGITEKPAEPSTPSEPTTPSEPSTPSADSEKAQLVALFNAETAKVAQGSYKWSRECKYNKDLKVEGIAISTIQSVVDEFLGIGNKSGNKLNAGKYAIIPTNLKESDIKSFTNYNGEVVLYLNDSNNPDVGSDTPFSHVSNDIVTMKDVEDKLPSMAKLNSFHAYYYDIVVSAVVDKTGAPESFSIRYKLYAKLGAKALGKDISGDATVETRITYTDFKY